MGHRIKRYRAARSRLFLNWNSAETLCEAQYQFKTKVVWSVAVQEFDNWPESVSVRLPWNVRQLG